MCDQHSHGRIVGERLAKVNDSLIYGLGGVELAV
jgi:hypothetical protein